MSSIPEGRSRPLGLLGVLVGLLLIAVLAIWAPWDGEGKERGGQPGAARRGEGAVASSVVAATGQVERVTVVEGAAEEERPDGAAGGTALRIRVLDAGGVGIPGARLRIARPRPDAYGYTAGIENWDVVRGEGRFLRAADCDADGSARIDGLPPSLDVIVEASAPGHARRLAWIRTSAEGKELDAGTMTLEPGRELRIEFVEETGEAIAGVRFDLLVWGPEPTDRRRETVRYLEGRADEAGRAVLASVPHGPVRVAGVGEFVDSEEFVQIEPGVDEARVVLHRGMTVSGTVREKDGTPVAGAEIVLFRDYTGDAAAGDLSMPWGYSHFDLKYLRSEVRTDASGRFRKSGLPAGTLYTVTAFVPPNQVYASRVLAEVEGVEVVIPDRHRVSGHVEGLAVPSAATVSLEEIRERGGNQTPPEFMYSFFGDVPPCEESGRFQRTVPAGKYRVLLRAPGLECVLEEELEVTGDLDLGVLRAPAGATVVLHVPALRGMVEKEQWNATTMRGVMDTGWFSDEEEFIWRRQRSLQPEASGDGTLRYTHLRADPYWFVVEADGMVPVGVKLDEAPGEGETIERTLELEPAGRIDLLVRGGQGEGKGQVQVRCRPVKKEPMHPAHAIREELGFSYYSDGFDLVTAADGVASFADLVPGHYELLHLPGDPDDYVDSEREKAARQIAQVEVKSGERVEVVYRLDTLPSVEIEVLEGAAPVAGARVGIWKKESEFLDWERWPHVLMRGVTDASGRVRFEGLADGEYTVAAQATEEEVMISQRVELTAGQEPVRLVLPSAAVRFRAVDAQGRGLVARGTLSRVVATDPSEGADGLLRIFSRWKAGEAYAGPNGEGGFEHVPPGRYRLQVTAGEEWDRWGFTEAFEVGEDALDLGDVPVQTIVRGDVTAQGLDQWDGYRCDFFLERTSDGVLFREVYLRTVSSIDVDQEFAPVPEGEYVFAITDSESGKVLWRSPPFEARLGQEFAPRITMPNPSSVGARTWQ